MPSFEELLNKPASEVERPKPLPVGTYHCLVDGPPEPVTAKTGTQGLRFTFKVIRPLEDVDAALAAEQQVVGKTVRDTYWITEESLYRLTDMLEHLGLDKNGGTIKELVSYAPGKQLLMRIKHQASQDGTTVYANVDSTAAV